MLTTQVRIKSMLFMLLVGALVLSSALVGFAAAPLGEGFTKGSITASKTWDDYDDVDGIRPESVTVRLMIGDTEVRSGQIGDAEGWEITWEGLDALDANADPVAYIIVEGDIPGYTAEYTQPVLLVTAPVLTQHEPNNELTIGYDTNIVIAKKGHEWFVWTWGELTTAQQDYAAQAVAGVIAEYAYPESFTDTTFYYGADAEGLGVRVDGDKIIFEDPSLWSLLYFGAFDTTSSAGTILNTHMPVVDRTVTKVWDDANDVDKLRPASVTVQLMIDGQAAGEPVVLNAAGGWAYTWAGLPRFGLVADIETVYGVEEITAVDGYTTTYSVDTFTITNKHVPVPVVDPEKPVPVDPGKPTPSVVTTTVPASKTATNPKTGDPSAALLLLTVVGAGAMTGAMATAARGRKRD